MKVRITGVRRKPPIRSGDPSHGSTRFRYVPRPDEVFVKEVSRISDGWDWIVPPDIIVTRVEVLP